MQTACSHPRFRTIVEVFFPPSACRLCLLVCMMCLRTLCATRGSTHTLQSSGDALSLPGGWPYRTGLLGNNITFLVYLSRCRILWCLPLTTPAPRHGKASSPAALCTGSCRWEHAGARAGSLFLSSQRRDCVRISTLVRALDCR